MGRVDRWTDERLQAYNAKRASEAVREDGFATIDTEVDVPRAVWAPPPPADVAPQLSLLGNRVYTFVLPMPPTVNRAWHALPNGGKALTDEAREFRSLVIARVRGVMKTDPPLACRIELTLRLMFTTKRRSDIDNRVKPLQDALTHARAYGDDCQIDRLIIERVQVSGPDESCTVRLEEIGA